MSLDFGLKQFVKCTDAERLTFYREFLYETDAMDKGKGARIAVKVVEKERRKGFTVKRSMRFRYRTRYFTDSSIIGAEAFVFDTYQICIRRKKIKTPRSISGLGGIYSLKRLFET